MEYFGTNGRLFHGVTFHPSIPYRPLMGMVFECDVCT